MWRRTLRLARCAVSEGVGRALRPVLQNWCRHRCQSVISSMIHSECLRAPPRSVRRDGIRDSSSNVCQRQFNECGGDETPQFPQPFPIEVRVSAAMTLRFQPGSVGRTVGLQFTSTSAHRMSHIFSRSPTSWIPTVGDRIGERCIISMPRNCARGIHVGESSKNSEQHLTQMASSATNTLTVYSACPTQSDRVDALFA